MRVLITGHHGFVGRHFHERMLADGHHVITCDIADPVHPFDCEEGFRRNLWGGVDLVIHCAATIPPLDKRLANDLIVAQDFATDALMFQWAERTRPRKIIYFSSSAAYPKMMQVAGLEHRLTEEDLDLDLIGTPDAMYGMTKLVGELQARELQRLGTDVLVLRPFTGYGTDQSSDYPFRAFIDRAQRREPVFDVWGDGSQVRDFIHIDDIVNAVMAMLKEGFNGPVNLGTGMDTTLLQFAHMVIDRVPGYSPAIRLGTDKPTGAVFRCADPRLMATIYQPQITLTEGIERALNR